MPATPETSWVVQLVEVRILRAPAGDAEPERWRFFSSDLQNALEARRLERNFGMDLDAAALVLDLCARCAGSKVYCGRTTWVRTNDHHGALVHWRHEKTGDAMALISISS